MDTEIREAIARSLPDLALIVRRDGVILSCVGGNAVRGLNAGEEEIPGRTLDTLWPESIATHVLQTVRRILKTRKPAQQRYQDGDLKLEMRFQVQGFDRVLVVCRDLGDGATSNDSGLYAKSERRCCRIATASKNRCAWRSTWPRCAKTPSASR